MNMVFLSVQTHYSFKIKVAFCEIYDTAGETPSAIMGWVIIWLLFRGLYFSAVYSTVVEHIMTMNLKSSIIPITPPDISLYRQSVHRILRVQVFLEIRIKSVSESLPLHYIRNYRYIVVPLFGVAECFPNKHTYHWLHDFIWPCEERGFLNRSILIIHVYTGRTEQSDARPPDTDVHHSDKWHQRALIDLLSHNAPSLRWHQQPILLFYCLTAVQIKIVPPYTASSELGFKGEAWLYGIKWLFHGAVVITQTNNDQSETSIRFDTQSEKKSIYLHRLYVCVCLCVSVYACVCVYRIVIVMCWCETRVDANC